MNRPTAEQSRGYDIMIWAGEDDRIMASTHTLMGEVVLHGLLPDYVENSDVEVTAMPSEFFADVPPTTRIGLVRPQTNEIFLVALGALHS